MGSDRGQSVTSKGQSKIYLTLCNEVVEDKAKKISLGCKKVEGNAVVTLDKTMAKKTH